MDLLLILTYVAFCYAVFKIFKIPVNQWSLATAALGGIIGISLLLLAMNYNHPFTKNARIYYPVTPIIVAVEGRVTEVPVKANVPLKEGDVLFKIDSTIYEARMASAEAAVKEATAQRDRTKQVFDRYARGNTRAGKDAPFAEVEVENRRGVYLAAEASLEEAEAKMATAKFNLEQTVMRAPGDGFVTQLALRPGVYAVAMPFRPVMVFIHSGKSDRALIAAFQQNTLQRVIVGDEAEVAFDAVPGRVFKGKVSLVPPVIAAGQFVPSGGLQDFGVRTPGGRIPAIIEITDDMSGYQIPLGSAAQVALYTHHMHHLSIMRKILLRMVSWKNYIYMEGH